MDTKPQFPKQVYAAWLAAGVGTVDQQVRYKAALSWYNDQERGDLFTAPIAQPEAIAQPDVVAFPERVKVHSLIGFASIKNNLAGAWRLWCLAHALDQPGGSNKVSASMLRAYLKHLKVSERVQRYWLAAALKSGLFTEIVFRKSGDKYYRYVAWERGAAIVGAERVGRPAEVGALALVKSGWKRHVWAGYLATLNGRPLSQKKKFELTGVDPRLQRLWQSPDKRGDSLSYPVFRYSDSDIHPAKVEAMSELTGRHYFVASDGSTRQRLPDGRIVHSDIARSLKRGRSKKAQRLLNALLCLVDQEQAEIVRLFAEAERPNDRLEQVKRLLRRARAMDYDNPRRPDQVFSLIERRGRVTNLHASPVIPALTSAL